MKNTMTTIELKQYVIAEAKKLMKAEMLKEEKNSIVEQLKRLDESEENKSYSFKVKHDKGSKTIKTTGSSEGAAKKKIASAEGCPESAITIMKEDLNQQPAQQPTHNKQMGGAEVTKFGREINMVIANYFNQGFLPSSILEALKGSVQHLESKISNRVRANVGT